MPHKKYAAIAATLGWEEYEVKEDGLFLQPEEAEALNAALVTADTNVRKMAEDNTTIQQLTETLTGMETTIATAQETMNTQAARITELENQVKEMGAQASGKGTTLITKEDTKNDKPAKVGLMDPEHPVNVAVAKKVAAKTRK